jgi:hypothetical protein
MIEPADIYLMREDIQWLSGVLRAVANEDVLQRLDNLWYTTTHMLDDLKEAT